MKTAVITGVSRGIGLALANKFLDEGYKVIGTSTSGKADIENENLEIIKLDLSDSESISKATNEIIEKTDEIDILINNAGINLEDWGVYEVNTEVLRKTLAVNLIGLIDFTEHLLPKISNSGQIVNLSSRLGSLSDDWEGQVLDNPCYRISKAALNMYTKTLASRLKENGIIVSSVHPGWVKTEMGGDDAPREPKEAAEQIYKLAITAHETGQFWYDNEKFPW